MYLRYWLLSFHIVTFLYSINFISEIWILISITLYISVRLVNWILTLLCLCTNLGFVLIELWVALIHLGSILVDVFSDKYHNILGMLHFLWPEWATNGFDETVLRTYHSVKVGIHLDFIHHCLFLIPEWV